jgi:hypothetical protein
MPARGTGSIGRAPVSKTGGCRFESCVPRCGRVLRAPRFGRCLLGFVALSGSERAQRVVPLESATDRRGRLAVSHGCPAAWDLGECRAGPPATAAGSSVWVVRCGGVGVANRCALLLDAVSAGGASCGGPSCRARRNGCAASPGLRRAALSRQERLVPRPPGLRTRARSITGSCLSVCRALRVGAVDVGGRVVRGHTIAVARGLGVRVAAWMRSARPHATARLLNGWEPVVLAGARQRPGWAPQAVDALAGVAPRRRSTRPGAVIGAKFPDFCAWLFGLLGELAGDSLDDLYPGSGIVTGAWKRWTGALAEEELVPVPAPPPTTGVQEAS